MGEKAYYLLTAYIKKTDELTQVMFRAASDKPHGLNGFLNEMVDTLKHVVSTVQSAREIGVIKKEHVINIIDSIVQRTTFDGEGTGSISIKESVVQRTEFQENQEGKVSEEERQSTLKKVENLKHKKEQNRKHQFWQKNRILFNRFLAFSLVIAVISAGYFFINPTSTDTTDTSKSVLLETERS
ncbi:MAG: hypothetical protein E4G94_03120 [ANME-2 cluster archaeon]|nr:MAG: hypothetical protein E4G94_03120 [ANME-2 cluster archaeon]